MLAASLRPQRRHLRPETFKLALGGKRVSPMAYRAAVESQRRQVVVESFENEIERAKLQRRYRIVRAGAPGQDHNRQSRSIARGHCTTSRPDASGIMRLNTAVSHSLFRPRDCPRHNSNFLSRIKIERHLRSCSPDSQVLAKPVSFW